MKKRKYQYSFNVVFQTNDFCLRTIIMTVIAYDSESMYEAYQRKLKEHLATYPTDKHISRVIRVKPHECALLNDEEISKDY